MLQERLPLTAAVLVFSKYFSSTGMKSSILITLTVFMKNRLTNSVNSDRITIVLKCGYI